MFAADLPAAGDEHSLVLDICAFDPEIISEAESPT